MRFLKSIIFLVVPLAVSAQTTTQNYIVTTVPYQAVSDPSTLTDANSNTSIQYFDGLGRPSQAIQRAITPNSADLITAIDYDALGRESTKWLPAVVSSNNGAYYSSYSTQAVTSNGGDAKPYSTIEYEPSPMNRVSGQYGPGNDWYSSSKKVATAYTKNASDVKYFYVANNLLKCYGTYSVATLNGILTTDEDGKTAEEFTDKIGNKVLKRVAGSYDTYYVYDEIGNLRYVLPPLAADGLSTDTTGFSELSGSILDRYGYIYHYDGRKRITEKKLPGTDWLYLVYDKADRLILSQDGNQRLNSKWTVNKYDKFGRLLYSGILSSTNGRSQMESSYSSAVTNETYTGSGTIGGYTCSNLAPASLLAINYYDDYSCLNFSNYSTTTRTTLTNTSQGGYTTPDLTHVKNLLTGTCIYHLDDPAKFELTALYYDKYGRTVQSRSSNHLAGYDITYSLLDFTGKATQSYKTHGISGASTTITEKYVYTFDKAQRLLTTTHQLNGGSTVTLSTNTYDELGRLSTKTLGGTLDATAYTYNVRSWLSGISGPRFTENLYYTTNPVSLPSFTACYNGNISGMKWSIPSEALGYDRAYSFTYNALNQMTSGNYCGKSGSSTYSGTTGKYDETVTYDKMGNIQTLTRLENGSGLNQLTYDYIGNQLLKVDNALSPVLPYGSEAFNDRAQVATEYLYNKNGNVIYDANGAISTIGYNLLNLPEVVQFSQGHQNRYSYSMSGKKLTVTSYTLNSAIVVPLGTINDPPSGSNFTKVTTDNIDNKIYQNSSLKQIQTSEGYSQGGVYYYYLKDHLGNTRIIINSSGTIIEKSHYYPFGMRFYPESSSNSNAIAFRYNGKEYDSMNELNQYDYGARFYDPAIGRWSTPDPLAEKSRRWSPYNYCVDNPLKFSDPDGMEILIRIYDQNKKAIDLQYTNGKLINSDKSEYKGKDSYALKVLNQLNDIKKLDKDVNKMVSGLESSSVEHIITYNKEEYEQGGSSNKPFGIVMSEKDENGNWVDRSGSKTNFDPDADTDVRGAKDDPRSQLTHELSHASDLNNNTTKEGYTKNGVPLSEVDAVNMQNKIRVKVEQDKRTTYYGIEIPKNLLK